MSSFIDLMSNDVWGEADIKARLHAEIRSEVSELVETELNRALQGAMLGMHTLTPHEQEGLLHFKTATDRVALLGECARADAALLAQTMALEVAQRRLAQPQGDTLDEQDAADRAAAIETVAQTGVPALELATKRATHHAGDVT